MLYSYVLHTPSGNTVIKNNVSVWNTGKETFALGGFTFDIETVEKGNYLITNITARSESEQKI